MRVRILMALSAVVLLSAGAATAAGAPKQPYPASQQVCLSAGGNFSTKPNSSFYASSYKKQRVLWTCNSFSPSSTTSGTLAGRCSIDGGPASRSDAPGFVTCWKN
jgi:hypothetical protein